MFVVLINKIIYIHFVLLLFSGLYHVVGEGFGIPTCKYKNSGRDQTIAQSSQQASAIEM